MQDDGSDDPDCKEDAWKYAYGAAVVTSSFLFYKNSSTKVLHDNVSPVHMLV